MRNNVVIVTGGVLGVGLLAVAVASLFLAQRSNRQLAHTRQLLQGMENEMASVRAEKGKLSLDREKVQADVVSYVSLNTRLQEERDSLQKKLKDAQSLLENQEAELERMKNNMEKLTKEGPVVVESLQKERKELQDKIQALESGMKKERSLFHYNLGVAYTQAKLYAQAIQAYEKSLGFNPDNPEAYYNLGLLYDNFKQDTEKAILYYRKYIEFKPEAEDKEQVKEMIEKLSQK